jgi:hypothetical protein
MTIVTKKEKDEKKVRKLFTLRFLLGFKHEEPSFVKHGLRKDFINIDI